MTFEVTVDGNDRLTVDDSRENRLGGGGQGEVYRVEYKGRQLALKWYTARAILENDGFRENLRGNTRRESPDKCFVWPQHFVEDGKGGYGYLMDVIDTGAPISVPVGDENDGTIFFDVSAELRSGYTNFNGTVGYRINF